MRELCSKRSGKASGWLILIVVAVAAAAGWYFFLRSTPEKTVKQFMAAGEANDIEAIKPLVSSKSREAISLMAGMMPKGLQGSKEGKPGADYEMGPAKMDGGKATVPVTFAAPEKLAQMTGNKGLTVYYVLIKEKGKWVIDIEETGKAFLGDLMGPGGMQR